MADDIFEEKQPLPREGEFTKIIQSGDLDAVKQYIETHDATEILKKDEFGRNYLYDAVFVGDIDIVKALIDFGFFPRFVDEFTGDTLVHIAAAEGHYKLMCYFIDEWKADANAMNKEGKTPLFYGLMNLVDEESQDLKDEYTSVCRSLIKRGARFQDNMRTKLFNNLKHLECQLVYDLHFLVKDENKDIAKKIVKFLIDDFNSYNADF